MAAQQQMTLGGSEPSRIFREAQLALAPAIATPNPEKYVISEAPLWWRPYSQPLDAPAPSDVHSSDWHCYLELCSGWQTSARLHRDSKSSALIENCTARPSETLEYMRRLARVYKSLYKIHPDCTNKSGREEAQVDLLGRPVMQSGSAQTSIEEAALGVCCCQTTPAFWFWEGIYDMHGQSCIVRGLSLISSAEEIIPPPHQLFQGQLLPYFTAMLNRGQPKCLPCRAGGASRWAENLAANLVVVWAKNERKRQRSQSVASISTTGATYAGSDSGSISTTGATYAGSDSGSISTTGATAGSDARSNSATGTVAGSDVSEEDLVRLAARIAELRIEHRSLNENPDEDNGRLRGQADLHPEEGAPTDAVEPESGSSTLPGQFFDDLVRDVLDAHEVQLDDLEHWTNEEIDELFRAWE